MIFDPPDWATYELVIMRALLLATIVHLMPAVPPADAGSHPVGLARANGFLALARPTSWRLMRLGLVPFGVLYVADVAVPIGVAYVAAVAVTAVTILNSQGWVNHGWHLPAVALVAQGAGAATHELMDALDASGGDLLLADSAQTGVWWAVQAVAAVYFVSGVSKLARTGFRWVSESYHLVVNMVAKAEMEAVDHPARVATRDRAMALADWLGGRPVLSMGLFGAGLWVELIAPLFLLNRATLVLGGLALIALHLAIEVVLLVRFRLNVYVLVILYVNVPYLVVEGLRVIGVPDSALP